MKKLKAVCAKLPAPVVTLCYLLALCIALLTGLINFGYDAVQQLAGNQQMLVFAPQDFTVYNMEPQDGAVWITTTDDPQLVLETLPTGVRRLAIEAEYDRAPYERCVYYTEKPGQPFSAHVRAWPEYSADGVTAYYELPMGVQSLRIDPGSLAALEITFGKITLNPHRPFYTYFLPDGGGWFCLAVCPALAAACIKWIIECKRHLSDKKERKQSA